MVADLPVFHNGPNDPARKLPIPRAAVTLAR